MNAIDWSSAPEGATHYRASIKTFYRQDVRAYEWDTVEWRMIANDLGEFRWSSDLIERPVSEWTGKGLPPVGMVCELSERVLLADSDTSDWFEAGTKIEIGGHATFNGATGPVCAVCVVGENFTGTLSEACLRLIRTPEQIATEEKKAAIEQTIKDLKAINGCGFYSIAEDLYDAGYRKQVMP